MEFETGHFLSILVAAPMVLALLGLFIPGVKDSEGAGLKIYRSYAFVGSLFIFLASLFLLKKYNPAGEEFQFMESVNWIPSLGISYLVGMDGISLWLILLTTFLMPICILSSFHAIEHRNKEYYFFLLALESTMLGAFVSLDLFLFYVFWEAMLIPMYFLVGVWGGKDRVYAATKFFLYTVAGSLIMLVAIFYLSYEHRVQFGNLSTSMVDLYRLVIPGGGYFSVQALLFLAFALAFAIKVPLFPFHTWLPDAHVQAPTAGSVILAGVLLKMGGYGFVRIAFPLFLDAVQQYQLIFLALGSIAILYGAWVAMVQPDMKKLVAYSSVSHMGYVVVGLFALSPLGMTGSIYQMLNHGISTGALFLLVGFIYERRHTREFSEFGGIAKVMPLYAVAFIIITLSSVALPGTNGFVGEFLILLGVWGANPAAATLAALGVIFGAVYMLLMVQKLMLGPITKEENKRLKDLNFRELSIMAPLVILAIVMGVMPGLFLEKMEPSIARLVQRSTHGMKEETPEAKRKKDFNYGQFANH